MCLNFFKSIFAHFYNLFARVFWDWLKIIIRFCQVFITYIYIYMYERIAYLYIHAFTSLYIQTCMYMFFVYTYKYICIHLHTFISKYIHKYTHIIIHRYVYTIIHRYNIYIYMGPALGAGARPPPPQWYGSKTYILATFSWNPPKHMVFTMF